MDFFRLLSFHNRETKLVVLMFVSWVSFGFLGFPGFHIFLGFSWILLGLAEFSFWILEGLLINLSS